MRYWYTDLYDKARSRGVFSGPTDTRPVYQSNSVVGRIDALFLGKSWPSWVTLTAVEHVNTGLSDHFAVIAQLDVRKGVRGAGMSPQRVNQPRRHRDTEILCVFVSLWPVFSVLSASSVSISRTRSTAHEFLSFPLTGTEDGRIVRTGIVCA